MNLNPVAIVKEWFLTDGHCKDMYEPTCACSLYSVTFTHIFLLKYMNKLTD